MKKKIGILCVLLLGPVLFAQAQQPFVMFAVKISMQPSQVYNVFQMEDSTYRVFTRAGQIGSPVPYPPDGLFFDVSRDAKQMPFHRPFPLNTLGEYLPGDYYYTGLRYDSADTRYSRVGLFNPQLKPLWQLTTPNKDVSLKLWPVEGERYISVKQNGRILKFNKNGFIDSASNVYYPGMQWLYVRDVGKNNFVYSPWQGQWKNLFYDTLILVKSNLQGTTQSVYKYYQKDGLIFYSRFEPLPDSSGYELRFLTRTDSTATLSYFNYKIIRLDTNLQTIHVKELDTTLVNKYANDYYYFTVDARLKHGFANLESVPWGFSINVYNDNWELQHQTYITDSIIKANSTEYKSFDVRPWIVDVMKTAKDGGLIIAGHYRVGGFPYETLPFLIKTDTAGNVVWLDAGVGDFPAGKEEVAPVHEAIAFYPNPVAGTLYYQSKTPGFESAGITILDMMGKEVATAYLRETSGSISLSHLPAGIYVLRYEMGLGNEKVNATKRLVLQ